MKNKIAFLIMRVSLGIAFLLFGVGKFRNDIWVETIKSMDFFLKLPWDVNISVFLIGALEVLTGISLIVGLFTRLFAAIASAQLLGILILLKFEETRDFGLLGAAVYMALARNESFGIDWLWEKYKGGARRKDILVLLLHYF